MTNPANRADVIRNRTSLLATTIVNFRLIPFLVDDEEKFRFAYQDLLSVPINPTNLILAAKVFRLAEQYGAYNIAACLLRQGYTPESFDWKSIDKKIGPTKFPLPYYPPIVFSYYLTKGWGFPDELSTFVPKEQTWWFLITGKEFVPMMGEADARVTRWSFLDYLEINTGQIIHGSI
jgi:hypothetical protein